ncbi:hypothetical protein QJS66_09495 [Kocuria rhizophila]|nr:hypothetical protein QJS66_09495 [Kocuria rhizophila]
MRDPSTPGVPDREEIRRISPGPLVARIRALNAEPGDLPERPAAPVPAHPGL